MEESSISGTIGACDLYNNTPGKPERLKCVGVGDSDVYLVFRPNPIG